MDLVTDSGPAAAWDVTAIGVPEALSAAELGADVAERTPRGIAAAVNRVIRTGRVVPGQRLPTVRDVARELGVSPGTVSEAWQALTSVGAIESRGRAGSFVRGTGHPDPRRYRGIGAAPGPRTVSLDLSTGIPDPDLLPDLSRALNRLGSRGSRLTSSYLDEAVLPDLEGILRQSWPGPVDRITVLDGALDGLSRVVDTVVRFGDSVCVENPTFPPLLDLLERVGARVIPLSIDHQGVLPGALAAALPREPVALMIQPRAHNPTGASLTAERVRALAAVLAPSRTLVIEDDHSGDIATGHAVSLASLLPRRTVHIRSYSKSHGPDLRIAAVGGPAEVMDPLIARRMLGPGWTSRVLQQVLLDLLTDSAATQAIDTARAVYAERRAALASGLAAEGIAVQPGDGINMWVPVEDERAALVTLAATGVRVAPGEPFVVGTLGCDHVRITTGRLPGRGAALREAAHRLAADIAHASRPGSARRV